MAKLLIRLTSAPYGTSDASDGLDFALAATNYGHEVVIIFEGNGLYQLLPQKKVNGVKDQSKRLKSLPFFDIEECYYAQSDIERQGMGAQSYSLDIVSDLAEPLDDAGIIMLIEQADHVVTF